jgi:hypothetical protein
MIALVFTHFQRKTFHFRRRVGFSIMDLVMDTGFEAGKKQLSAPRRAEPGATKEALRLLVPWLAHSEFVCHFLLATKSFIFCDLVAGTTGLEPATSAVTD